MKITHEMVKKEDIYNIDYHRGTNFSFCSENFRFYFKFGRRSVVFFIVSDRKPRHGEAFKLVRDFEGGNCWSFADINLDEHPEEDESPWPFDFDEYLNNTFDTAKPVYIWVEYE